MAKIEKVEDIRNIISNASRALQLQQEAEKKVLETKLSNSRAEFNRIRAQNHAILKATGIIEIFNEIIEKKIVVLTHAYSRVETVKKSGLFGNTIRTKKLVSIPEEPAYISMVENEFENLDHDNKLSFNPNKCEVEAKLIFNRHTENNNYSDSGFSTVSSVISARTSDGEVRLDYDKDNIIGKSREELVERVGHLIVSKLGLNLPQLRNGNN